MIFPDVLRLACSKPSVVSLDAGTGGTIFGVDGSGGPYNTTVGLRFNTDGTVEKGFKKQSDPLAWSAAGRWYNPGAPGDSTEFRVRYTNLVDNGPGLDDWTSGAAVDVWTVIASSVTWLATDTTTNGSGGDFTATFQVEDTLARYATGSSVWTVDIENTS
jgi:hypothetical protein